MRCQAPICPYFPNILEIGHGSPSGKIESEVRVSFALSSWSALF